MNKELTKFLRRNRACADGIGRLEASGAETLADAWKLAAPADLVWGITRPGVMSPEQRRQFLVFVLESIEDNLTDPRSKNILEKLRTKSPITEDDASAADAAYAARSDAAVAWEAWAAAWAARAAADAADAAEAWAARAARAATDAADAAEAAARAARAEAWAARKAAREQQARWIHTNLKLADLRTK